MVLKKFLLLPPSYRLARIARPTCEGATEPCKPVALKSLLQPVLQQRKQEVSVNLTRAVELKEAKAGFLLLEHFPEGNHKSDAAALRRFGGWVERRERDSRPVHHHFPSLDPPCPQHPVISPTPTVSSGTGRFCQRLTPPGHRGSTPSLTWQLR